MTANRDLANTSGEVLPVRRAERLTSEAILARCQVLPESDRALIRAIFLGQQTASEVARVRAEPTRVVRRHLNAILARIDTPEFLFVLRHRARWGKQRRQVATALFIDGLTIKKTAAAMNLSYFDVRRQRDAILGMMEAPAASEAPAVEGARAFLKGVGS